jgi:hypothetical protein
MRKRVKSTDPRKRVILEAFRACFKGSVISKITDVIDHGGDNYSATVLQYEPIPGKAHGKYKNLGRHGIVYEDYFEAKLRLDENDPWRKS